MNKKMVHLLTLLLLPLVLLNLNCSPAVSIEENTSLETAPDFSLSALDGTIVTLSQFKGDKNVLLVFGATWCPACRHEIPELKEVYDEYKDDDLKLLYIDIQESQKKVAAFSEKHGLPYTVLLDKDSEAAQAYGVQYIPHITVINKDGMIYYEGSRPNSGLLVLLSELTAE
ncbi:MAG: TlpA family protein disulfide reductase [Candidatus Omnitrophica bacterium]|nr:TlpA family protein disulfide reductase [Candidatus Omnitrophota bacterium]